MNNNFKDLDISKYTYDKYLDGECEVIDSHCHIGLMQQPSLYASALNTFKVISFGTKPQQYKEECEFQSDNIYVGLGLHPWEVSNNLDEVKTQLTNFIKHLHLTNCVGEIGLDFSNNLKDSTHNQLYAFTEICKALSKTDKKIISVHSVKAGNEVLKILHETGADINNDIVLHWFSGSQQELTKAIRRGYYFSCGPKMLNSRKGYNYIQQIPSSQLLIESDLPWDNEPLTPSEHLNILNDFLIELREVVD